MGDVSPSWNLRSEEIGSILVMRLGAIGDALRVLPALRRLRLACPRARIAWAVEDWVFPLLEGNPNVDAFHILRRGRIREGLLAAFGEYLRFVRELRTYRYDLVLDFHGRLKSGLLGFFSGAPNRVGFARGQCTECNYLFTNLKVVLDDPLKNRVLRFLDLLGALDLNVDYDPQDNGVYLREGLSSWAQEAYCALGRPDVAVYPGCSKNQASYHRWPADKWVELLGRLADLGLSATVFWGPDEEDYSRELCARVKGGAHMAPKTDLQEMMALLGLYRAFIGSNTAAMHMAWFRSVPTVVFVGLAQERTDSPLPPIKFKTLRASAYEKRGVSKRHQPELTTAVSVDEAFEALLEILED